MNDDSYTKLLNDLRDMSSAAVESLLARYQVALSQLQPGSADYIACRRIHEAVKSQFEIRKARAGGANIDWPWLLTAIIGAYSFEPSAALGTALEPYGLRVPWPPSFYDSGQAALEIRIAADDLEQVERILNGFDLLQEFLIPGRYGYQFTLKTSQVRSRTKASVLVRDDGTASVVVASQEKRFDSFREALEHIARELYWNDPLKPTGA